MKAYTIEGMNFNQGITLDSTKQSEDYGKINLGKSSNEGGYQTSVKVVSNTDLVSYVIPQTTMYETFLQEDLEEKEDITQVLLVIKGAKNPIDTFFHTGDREINYCNFCKKSYKVKQEACAQCGRRLSSIFKPFPLQIIASAPASIFSYHFLGILPRDTILRIGYSLSNDNYSRYFVFEGKMLISSTWKERMLSGIF